MSWIRDITKFLEDLKRSNAFKFLGSPDQLVSEFINKLVALDDYLSLTENKWYRLRLQDKETDYYTITDGVFRWKSTLSIVAAGRWNLPINCPMRVRKYNGRYYLVNHWNSIAVFDEDWSFIGKIGHHHSTTGFVYATDITFIEYNGEPCVVVASMDQYQQIVCVSLNTSEVKWRITSLGGEINSVDTLPDGSLIVTFYRGDAPGSSGGYGYVAKFAPDGSGMTKVYAGYYTTGAPWAGEIKHPSKVRVKPDPNTGETKVFILCPSEMYIVEYIWDDVNDRLVYNRLLPRRFPATATDDITSWGFDVDIAQDRYIWVASNMGYISAASYKEANWVGKFGQFKQDINDEMTIGTFYVPYDVLIDGDKVIVVEKDNHRVQVVPLALIEDREEEFQYEAPPDELCSVQFMSANLDTDRWTLSIPRNQLPTNIPPREVYVCGVVKSPLFD